ncbi:14682_t:CDS:1 [Cetraspora pellucida]|uniref:14682_t:CDS:1 n=1 Tax=Cetraspora pellucida TaxID=1433469 RepID=A0ACA9MEY6_9GLOM|nr:14682_t:CDS:1 [Cetraspora pellucida]
MDAQKWLEREYPKNKACRGEFDQENKGKKRNEITKLDIRNLCLENKLEIKGFDALKKFDCRDNQLTKLEVYNCPQLTEIYCSDNQLKEVVLGNLPKLAKLNYGDNKLADLDLNNLKDPKNPFRLSFIGNQLVNSTKTEKTPSITSRSSTSSKKTASSILSHFLPSSPSATISSQQTVTEDTEASEKIQAELTAELEEAKKKIERLEKENQELREQLTILLTNNPVPYRNVLIIGRTGSGKSTLANVLLNKNENFEEVFKEDERSESVTRHVQVEEIEIKGIKYRIIDTVGIGDTGTVKGDDAKLEAIKTTYAIKDGLSQIFFVVAGRDSVDEREPNLYNLLKDNIFDENISKHITIVRTKFDYFTNEEKCKSDVEGLKKNR